MNITLQEIGAELLGQHGATVQLVTLGGGVRGLLSCWAGEGILITLDDGQDEGASGLTEVELSVWNDARPTEDRPGLRYVGYTAGQVAANVYGFYLNGSGLV